MGIFHAQSVEEVLGNLESGWNGLDQEEALRRAVRFGPNKLPEKGKPHLFLLFFRQFHSAFVYILLGAALLSLLFDHIIDVYIILAVIIFNALIGFFEERRAEHAIQSLKKLLVLKAKVYRGGELIKMPAEEIVPGDVIFLEEGDRVPADARLIEAKTLGVDEASLTGESFPVDKTTLPLEESTPLADQTNMVWLGTAVTAGGARAVVVATGPKTALGQIAESIAEVKTIESHFSKKTRELALQMGIIAASGALITFIIGFFVRKLPIFDIFLFSVASLVSGIPEGLPAVLAVVLAVGAHRMAKKQAIIRQLPAVETLGVATVVATDKTGTLTENSMMVAKIITAGGDEFSVSGNGYNPTGSFFKDGEVIYPLKNEDLSKLIHVAAVCNRGRVVRVDGRFDIIGDPTEAALAALGEKAGLTKEAVLEGEELVDELPFDQEKKYRSVLTKHKLKSVYVVGAFENVIDLSSHFYEKGKKAVLAAVSREKLIYAAENLAASGMRVLALAVREVPQETKKLEHRLVKNLMVLGIVGMVDPPRPEVKDAILKAKRAGLRIIMKTGDHKKTALAVAREIGLILPEDNPDKVALSEEELTKLLKLGEEGFGEAVRTYVIFARVTPKMKLKIVETLQKQGEIVAMTGDGVNDAPALKKSDIGIAMGRIGTDVARETSQMVLADDNFASIVDAIEEGRVVFTNVKQTSFYLITTNIAEDITIIITLLLSLPLPLLPIHVLWLNLISDGIPTIGLALERGHNHELEERPRNKKERILSKEIIPYLLFIVILMVAGTVLLFFRYLPEGLMKARTVAFTAMAFFQLWNVFNMRSLKISAFKIGFFSNKYITFAFFAAILVQLSVIHVPFLAAAFRFVPLRVGEWFLIIALTSTVFLAGELYKLFRKQ